jgi:hypothetical protein
MICTYSAENMLCTLCCVDVRVICTNTDVVSLRFYRVRSPHLHHQSTEDTNREQRSRGAEEQRAEGRGAESRGQRSRLTSYFSDSAMSARPISTHSRLKILSPLPLIKARE